MKNNRSKIPESKLIILYMIEHIQVKLSEYQVIKYLTKQDWANYFDAKQYLEDLSNDDMLKIDQTPNGTYYSISDIGKESIQLFYKEIMLSKREAILEFIKENEETIKLESGLVSDYIKLSENEYRVNLKILDGIRTSFELNVLVYSKHEAELLMNNWIKGASNVYKFTYSELIKE